MTYIDHRFMLLTFNTVLCVFTLKKEKKQSLKWGITSYFAIYYFALAVNILSTRIDSAVKKLLFDFSQSSLALVLYLIYFIGYISFIFLLFFRCMECNEFQENTFLIILAGTANDRSTVLSG